MSARDSTQDESLASSYRMIDVGAKAVTRRRALACGRFRAKESTIARVLAGELPKGDALRLAEIAGIAGAKRCADLLPLCHPLTLDSVRVSLSEARGASGAREIEARCEVHLHAKTGAEMEALMGVQAALLCVWDLTKGIDPELEIADVRLLEKEGGKSGRWAHPNLAKAMAAAMASGMASDMTSATASASASASATGRMGAPIWKGLRVAVLTISDRCSRKEVEDRTGPRLARAFGDEGATVVAAAVVPDEIAAIRERVSRWVADENPDVLVATGGTGASARDVTPEAFAPLWSREFPGFGEALRRKGAKSTPFAWIGRAQAGWIGGTLAFTLPGSRGAVEDGIAILRESLAHLLETSRGGAHGGGYGEAHGEAHGGADG